ncbi:PREDICTED: pectinesterase 2-like [Nelumbo nucifera]|nr:PREDICTED: pectinesterase 2-like [Nelumbo nucifera]
MALHEFLTLVILISLLVSPSFSDNIPPNIRTWCSQTSYPQSCEYYMGHHPHSSFLSGHLDSKKLAMQIALDQAIQAESNNMLLGPKCRNEREKAAWTDCIELYKNTIARLNLTVNPGAKCTDVDLQTWLSTALTNLETCRTGFVELGVSDYILPLMSNNVSKLISNILAINKPVALPNEQTYHEGFPTWVSPRDRKLLQATALASRAILVVAQDGSGNFKTINEAINAAAKQNTGGRFVIQVKAGTYAEHLHIGSPNLMLVGDGIGNTVITGSMSVGGGSTTFNSATVAVVGDGFIARDITFRNTAGPGKGQAVALRSGSDLSVFYRCSFEGYQDTLYVHSERQFYRECAIYGTVDFIFGNAAVVLQNCNIFSRKPINGVVTVTAQGRIDPNQNTGIVIHTSQITAASDLKPVQSSVKAYLGRPWRQYSRTVILKSFLDNLIQPVGWLEWSGSFGLNTLYYGEYQNTGPGSSTANRVKWGGYRVITSVAEASKFTVGNFIAGSSWLPASNVPFTSGL